MTITTIAVHDYRVRGEVHPQPDVRVVRVGQGATLNQVLNQIHAAAHYSGGSVPHLRIYAHGFSRPPANAGPRGAAHATMRPPGGPPANPGNGRVILLSAEQVHAGNAADFGRRVSRLVTEKITIYSCCAAAPPDGRALCTTIARHAGVPVVASELDQRYSRPGASLIPAISDGWINMHEWEGRVMEFSPDGGIRLLFTGPPSRH